MKHELLADENDSKGRANAPLVDSRAPFLMLSAIMSVASNGPNQQDDLGEGRLVFLHSNKCCDRPRTQEEGQDDAAVEGV